MSRWGGSGHWTKGVHHWVRSLSVRLAGLQAHSTAHGFEGSPSVETFQSFSPNKAMETLRSGEFGYPNPFATTNDAHLSVTLHTPGVQYQ